MLPKKIFEIRPSEMHFPALWGKNFLFPWSKSNANKTGQNLINFLASVTKIVKYLL